MSQRPAATDEQVGPGGDDRPHLLLPRLGQPATATRCFQGAALASGCTTRALPPPRRTGSAAASISRPRKAMPVAAPIWGGGGGSVNDSPIATSWAASG